MAQELFTDQGYDGTSLREIADRLGFTKAALYYHFRSKEEILVALLEPGNELLARVPRATHPCRRRRRVGRLPRVDHQPDVRSHRVLQAARTQPQQRERARRAPHVAHEPSPDARARRRGRAHHHVGSHRAGADGGRTRRGHRLRRLGAAPPRVGAARSTAQRAHRRDARHPETSPRLDDAPRASAASPVSAN